MQYLGRFEPMDRVDFARVGAEFTVGQFAMPPGKRNAPRCHAGPQSRYEIRGRSEFFMDFAAQGSRFILTRLNTTAGKAVKQRRDDMLRPSKHEQPPVSRDHCHDTFHRAIELRHRFPAAGVEFSESGSRMRRPNTIRACLPTGTAVWLPGDSTTSKAAS